MDKLYIEELMDEVAKLKDGPTDSYKQEFLMRSGGIIKQEDIGDTIVESREISNAWAKYVVSRYYFIIVELIAEILVRLDEKENIK